MDELSDEALVEATQAGGPDAVACERELLCRYQARIANWCLQVCHDRDEAADVAQDVLLKVHTKLSSFRGDSRFSTWLYTLTRRTALDRLAADRRRREIIQVSDPAFETAADEPLPESSTSREQVLERLGEAMQRHLAPIEARVVYLHYVDGLTLPAITRLLRLDNKSGAKAHLVGGMRKLRKHFGPWLARQEGRSHT